MFSYLIKWAEIFFAWITDSIGRLIMALTKVKDSGLELDEFLASTDTGKGASLVGVEDAGTYYVGTTVEAILQEVGVMFAAISDTDDQVASEVPFTPTGNIVATNVQAALAEVDAEKALLAGDAAQDFAVNNLTAAGEITAGTGLKSNGTNCILNADYTGGSPSATCSFQVERGSELNAVLLWDETSDVWKAGVGASFYEIIVTARSQTLTGDKNFTGALTHNSLAVLDTGDVLDENDMASSSSVYPPSQQSVVNYIASLLAPITPYRVRCYLGSSVSISNAVLTTVSWDSEEYSDSSSLHSTSTNPDRLTIPGWMSANSKVRFNVRAQWAPNSTGIRKVRIKKNGGATWDYDVKTADNEDSVSGEGCFNKITTDHFLTNPGDYYQIIVYQNSGGALNLGGSSPINSSVEMEVLPAP